MKTTVRRTALVAGSLALAYGVAGALLVPRLLRQALTDYAHTHGYRAEVKTLAFNPFTLTLTASGLSLLKDREPPALTVAVARASLSWHSLISLTPEIKELNLSLSHLKATRLKDGKIDLASLLPEPDPSTPWPKLSLERGVIQVSDALYEDLARGADTRVLLTHVSIQTQHFSTFARSTAWSIELTSDRQESATARAELTLEPFALRTEVTLQGLRLERLAGAGYGWVPGLSGSMDAEAGILYSASPAPTLSVTHGRISGKNLQLTPAASAAPMLTVGTWEIGSLKFDGQSQHLSLDEIAVHSAELKAHHTSDGWVEFSRPKADSANSSQSSSTIDIGSVAIEDSHLSVEDRLESQVVPISLGNINLRMGKQDNHLRRIQLETKFGAEGSLSIDGTLDADYFPAELRYRANRLSVLPFAAYLQGLIALRVDSGYVSGAGSLTYSQGTWVIGADATLDEVRTHDAAGEQELLGVRRLDMEGIDARWPNPTLKVRKVTADSPYADVRIARDGQVNIRSLLKDSPSKATTPSLQMSVESMNVLQGRVYFSDETQTPTFDATIGDLDGNVDGLSSDPSTRAHIAIKGRVDRYAPVSIEGDANFVSDPIAADMRMHFENLELTGLSPYSGRVAGYRIRKGKATADLHYRVHDRRVEASHKVRLRQFELGDRVEGQAGFGIPLGLVVALLKDRDGNIDLDVPLTGDFRDPNFHLGAMTRKVIGNLFGKIAASPFALLGSLFGSGEEISTVSFAAGSVELDTVARERLSTLGKAMNARPQVSLEVPIAISAVDAEALASTRYTELLLSRAREKLGDKSDAALLEQLQDNVEDRRSVLVALLGAAAVPAAAEISELEAQVRRQTTPTADDLEEVATARAQSIQATLVESNGVSAERIFLVRGKSPEVTGRQVQLKLGLK